MVFGTNIDGAIKSCLKATANVQEIICNCTPLSGMIEEIVDMLAKEVTPAPAALEQETAVENGNGSATSDLELGHLVSKEQIALDTDDQLPGWRDHLDETLAKFITLLPDGDSAMAQAEELKRLSVMQEKVIGGNIMLLYDSKSAGEASSNPNCRLPSFNSKHLMKHVQAFVLAKAASADQDCCL